MSGCVITSSHVWHKVASRGKL
uniref:Uncharacterized protein n=1 Tax=Anguilla anguilla TaxID=7936 RepID=A0A0E9XW49_ANGAN